MVRSLGVVMLDLWGIVYMLWVYSRTATIQYVPRWMRGWMPLWLVRGWPLIVVTLLLVQAIAAGIYFYRLLVEQVTKQGPQYSPLDPKEGRWKPFKGHLKEKETEQVFEDEWEAEPEQKEMVTYMVKGQAQEGRKTLYLEFELDDYNSALAWHRFCQAVQSGQNFSRTEAVKRQGLSDSDWQRIYAEFEKRGCVIKAPKRGTPKLTPRGERWVRWYSVAPPPEPV